SEEQQPGWDYHDPETVDPELGVMDTLPAFRRTLHRAALEAHVVGRVGRSPQIAALWNTPLALPFVASGHTDEHATAYYEGSAPPRAASSSSTTCSPTRPTSSPARPPTASTCAPSPPARSRRSRRRTPCGCCAVPGRASDADGT